MAGPAGAHGRQHRLDHVDGTEVVDVEQLSNFGVLALLDRGQVAVTGVVDQHVDPAERVVGRRDRRRDLAGVGHVERHGQGPIAELVDEVLHRVGAPRGHHHAVAGFQCGAGDFATKAGGASGDQPARHLRSSLPAGGADTPCAARPARLLAAAG